MTEEVLEAAELPNEAIQLIKILIEFGYPQDPSEVPKWGEQVQLIQNFLSKTWKDDPSGKTMIKSLNFLYNEIDLNASQVSPAVWCMLCLVDKEKISDFVEGILSNSTTNNSTKIQNVLVAIIGGLCQCGYFMHGFSLWIFAFVKGLEARNNFEVLIDVSRRVIKKLTISLCLSYFRPFTYPIFRQFLYPVPTPHVFFMIIHEVPRIICLLQQDLDNKDRKDIFIDFISLIRILINRFPPTDAYEATYNKIKTILKGLPDKDFESDSMVLWDLTIETSSSWISSNHDIEASSSSILYKGLINQGNTCFMNSVLQVLYMTTRFRKELLEKELDASEKAAIDLQQLFALMQESNRTVLTPNGVADSTLPPTFLRGHQQDSSEYLLYLLDILHENEKKIIKRRRQSNGNEKKLEDKRKEEEENTVVERLFEGISMSTTTCSSCKRSFPKNDNFRQLHLSLPQNYKSCDLQELIDVSFQPEELCFENMYDCESCGTKRNAIRRHTIVKPPQHLILTLKLFRFDPVRKQRLKLHSKVKKTQSIELPVYNSSQLQTRLVMYDIKAVVLHSGSSLDGGHYFSSAVDRTGQWYIFNDSVVSVASYEWNSTGGTPYILLLRQSDIPDPPTGPLPSNLQLLVNRDNQKFLAEKRYRQQPFIRKRDYDDDWDDSPPNNGSLGGPGPSLVF